MYGRRIYGLCISALLLETAALRWETSLAAPGKAAVHWPLDWTPACICPRWDKATAQVGANRVGSVGQARFQCGTNEWSCGKPHWWVPCIYGTGPLRVNRFLIVLKKTYHYHYLLPNRPNLININIHLPLWTEGLQYSKSKKRDWSANIHIFIYEIGGKYYNASGLLLYP